MKCLQDLYFEVDHGLFNMMNPKLTRFGYNQGLLEGMTSSTSSGAEAIAAAERNADLLTAKAASGDPSAIPSICRISAAMHSSGTVKAPYSASFFHYFFHS